MNIEEATRFAEVYNDRHRFPSIGDVARELGIAYQTAKNRTVIYRNMVLEGADLPELIVRGMLARPIEDHEARFHDWTEAKCFEAIQKLQAAHPERVLTRNFFRNETRVSDSTWVRYFGTFAEFTRQAGLRATRQQHQFERQIAKHRSVDHYRELGIGRLRLGALYDRRPRQTHRTILVGSDFHDKETDRFSLRVFLDVCEMLQPDVVCLNGDVFDLPEFGRYNVDPREWDVVGRIKFVHRELLEPIRERSPGSQIDFIEGNHERRLLKHLADATPVIQALLSDLHGMTVSQLFGLSTYEVNYIARGDLAAWRVSDEKKEHLSNSKVYWHCLMAHHFPQARKKGVPGWNGHHHQHQAWAQYNEAFGSYEWHQLGAMRMRNAAWTDTSHWTNGFSVVHCDTETLSTSFEYIDTTGSFATGFGGYWRREASERADRVTGLMARRAG